MTPDRVADAEAWARGWRIPASPGGRRLYLTLSGKGPGPAALFIQTLGGCAAEAAWLQDALPSHIPGLAYDRAGLGLSDPAESQDPTPSTTDLSGLIDRLGRGAPPILVGLGHGGWMALQMAVRHPDKVAGLVLVDVPVPPRRRRTAAGGLDRATTTLRHNLARWGASAALAAVTNDPIGLPSAAADERRAILAGSLHHAGILREAADWAERADALPDLPPADRELPVAVVATARAGSSGHAAQIAPARRSRRGWIATAEGATLADLMGPRRGQVTVEAICHVRAQIH